MVMGAPEPIVVQMPRKGFCTECGNPTGDNRRKKCDDCSGRKPKQAGSHRPIDAASVTVPKDIPPKDIPNVTLKQPDPPKMEKAGDAKTARRAQLERSIVNDLNPALVQGFAMACAPIPRENFFTVAKEGPLAGIEVTPLGQQAMVENWQAKVLAYTAAELEDSPISQSVTTFVGPLIPILAGVAAVGVCVLHATKLVSVRDQLLAQYKEQTVPAEKEKEQAPQSTNGHGTPQGTAEYMPDLSDIHVA